MAKPKRLPKFVKLVAAKKPAKSKFDLKSFAEIAAKSAAGNELGKFIDSTSNDGLTEFSWEANLKGYAGWRWQVTVFQVDANTEPTVSEVVLVPGPDSLIAPDWVPWADRLADYQALQAELEKQAELDKELAADEITEEENDDVADEDGEEVAEESAISDLEQSEDTKQDSN